MRAALLSLIALSLACAHAPDRKDMEGAEIHYDLGVNLMKQGRAQEALKEFLASVERNPEFPEVHNALGLVYHWSYMRLEPAEKHFRKALELRPDFPDAANNLGALLAQKNDLQGARLAFERALSDPLYRTPYIAQTNLAWVVHLLGNTPGGEALARASLTAAPTYCAGHRQLARLLEAQHKQTDADASWERFAEYCPDEPEALYHLAQVQARRGAPSQASRSLMKCLEKAGAKPIAADCRTLLAGLPPLEADNAPPPAAKDPNRAGAAGGGARDLETPR